MKNFKTVDEYIDSFPPEVKNILKELRSTVKQLAPEAEEKISYGMPAYHLKGHLVYFAAFKDHVSLFPTSSPVEDSIPEVSKYRTGKGTLQFPIDQPMPWDLIKKIVDFRVKENLEKRDK